MQRDLFNSRIQSKLAGRGGGEGAIVRIFYNASLGDIIRLIRVYTIFKFVY